MGGTLSPEAEAWSRTALREGRRIWPFLAGMALIGYATISVTAKITPEEIHKNKFANPKAASGH